MWAGGVGGCGRLWSVFVLMGRLSSVFVQKLLAKEQQQMELLQQAVEVNAGA